MCLKQGIVNLYETKKTVKERLENVTFEMLLEMSNEKQTLLELLKET